MKAIPAGDVRWCTWGDDVHGRVFVYEGEFHRAIRPASEAFFRGLLDRGILADLAKRKMIVGTELTDLSLEGYALVLRHERIPFVTYPHEWSFSMLQDAARLVIRLNRALLEYGLVLTDCHAFNVAFRGATPLYVDVSSIVPYEVGAPLPDYSDFLSNYVYPLLLQEREGMTRIVRSLQQDELTGISRAEFCRLAGKMGPVSFRLGKREVNAGSLNGFLQRMRRERRGGLMAAALGLVGKLTLFAPSAPAAKALDDLERRVDAIRIRSFATQWGNYYDTSPMKRVEEMAARRPEDLDIRTRQICDAIRRAQPRTLIDLAGNEGLYSLAAVRLGVPQVVCADYDLVAVEKLYRAIRGTDVPVTPACLNVMMPGGGSHSMDAADRSVYARVRCEMALALALTHHLSLTQRIPFEAIAWTLAGYTERDLLVEFMPFGLGIGKPSPDLPEWYTLERFVKAFEGYFRQIEVLRTDMASNERVLLVCRK